MIMILFQHEFWKEHSNHGRKSRERGDSLTPSAPVPKDLSLTLIPSLSNALLCKSWNKRNRGLQMALLIHLQLSGEDIQPTALL
jgi:hypothetical protein